MTGEIETPISYDDGTPKTDKELIAEEEMAEEAGKEGEEKKEEKNEKKVKKKKSVFKFNIFKNTQDVKTDTPIITQTEKTDKELIAEEDVKEGEANKEMKKEEKREKNSTIFKFNFFRRTPEDMDDAPVITETEKTDKEILAEEDAEDAGKKEETEELKKETKERKSSKFKLNLFKKTTEVDSSTPAVSDTEKTDEEVVAEEGEGDAEKEGKENKEEIKNEKKSSKFKLNFFKKTTEVDSSTPAVSETEKTEEEDMGDAEKEEEENKEEIKKEKKSAMFKLNFFKKTPEVGTDAPAVTETDKTDDKLVAEENKEEEEKKDEEKEKKPTVFKQDFEENKVYLYQSSRTPKVPSVDPQELKIETYLKLRGIPYENVNHNIKKAKFPFIELNGVEIEYADILSTLAEKFGNKLTAQLSSEQINVEHAMIRMVENHLYCATVDFQSEHIENTVKGYNIDLPTYLDSKLPLPLLNLHYKISVCKKMQKKIKGQGFDDLLGNAKDDMKVLSETLGDKEFMFGSEPSLLDLTLFSVLAQLTSVDEGVVCPLRDHMTEHHANLVELVNRMKDRAWAEHWDLATGETLALNPHIPKPESEEEEEKEEVEKKDEEKEEETEEAKEEEKKE